MASSDKKVRKNQKKRERAKRDAAREKRRQLRDQANHSGETDLFFDSTHDNLFANILGGAFDDESMSHVSEDPGNPEISEWCDRLMDADGSQRLAMLRLKLSEELDAEWREEIFPDAVFECETSCTDSDYVGLLETLASDHRELYEMELLWFLRSRVTHYLASGDTKQIDDAVSQDAAAMKETGDAYYGIVSMLRLAGLSGPADTLAKAGFRALDTNKTMPWAVEEVFQYFTDSHVRQCVADGGDSDAIQRLESVMKENGANMDKDTVLLRAEMIRRLTGETKTKWVRNQLLGTKALAQKNRYLLGFEFAHWLSSERGIPPIAADELRGLLMDTFSSKDITMKSYYGGLSQSAFDKHLARMLGFMSLDPFKAPATLIAVEHFISFLVDTELSEPKTQTRSREVIANLNSQLQQAFGDEWASLSYLDPLRNSDQ